MNDVDIRMKIINILRDQAELASEQHRTAIAENAAQIASANAWDQYNPDDGIGSFSQNPYSSRLTHFSNSEMQARKHAQDAKAVYELAVEHFVTINAVSNDNLRLLLKKIIINSADSVHDATRWDHADTEAELGYSPMERLIDRIIDLFAK